MSQLTARDIRDRLAAQARDVAEHLLGHEGRREGHELRFGSIGGEAGKSLGVHLSGAKAGVWSDFATGQSGDLLDLWCAARNCDMGTAIAQAKEYLGVRDVRIDVAPRRPVATIARPDRVQPLGPAAMHWLREVRKLSAEAIAAYKLAQRGESEVCFPYLLPDGSLVSAKYRSIHEDRYTREAGSDPVLFGWQAIPATARSVVLCEGELKALAWWDYGFPALSVPLGGSGGAKQAWIESEYDRLARFDTIYLAMDEDKAGREAATAIIQRLGEERCATVVHPLPAEPGSKCINACVRHGVSRAAVEAAIKAARPRDPVELRSAADYEDELVQAFSGRGIEMIGLRTPWAKVGDELIFRPGEVTVVAGYSGHGKSQVVGFMACHAMRVGFRVCVASLEFRVSMWLSRLVRQLSAIAKPDAAYLPKLLEWCSERLWAFDAQGTAEIDRIVEVFRYARRRYGVTLFVIDNLTGCGVAEDDYEGQKRVVLTLTNFARDEDVHVWLVHHVRKSMNEDHQPDKQAIKGGGGITDLASTVLTVWRNKPKERAVAEAQANQVEVDEKFATQPDCRVSVVKQRNYIGSGSGEPSIRLWWAPGCFHYLAQPDHRPRAFVTIENAPQAEVGEPVEEML